MKKINILFGTFFAGGLVTCITNFSNFNNPFNTKYSILKDTARVSQYDSLRTTYGDLGILELGADSSQYKFKKAVIINQQYLELKNTPVIQEFLEVKQRRNEKKDKNVGKGFAGMFLVAVGLLGLLDGSYEKKKKLIL